MAQFYAISEAKAMVIAVFLQYLVYAFIYIIEGVKYVKIKETTEN